MFPPGGDQVEADRARKDARLLEEEAADEYVAETAGDPDAEYEAEEASARASRWGTVLAVIVGLVVLLVAAVLIYNFFVSRL